MQELVVDSDTIVNILQAIRHSWYFDAQPEQHCMSKNHAVLAERSCTTANGM